MKETPMADELPTIDTREGISVSSTLTLRFSSQVLFRFDIRESVGPITLDAGSLLSRHSGAPRNRAVPKVVRKLPPQTSNHTLRQPWGRACAAALLSNWQGKSMGEDSSCIN